eukprot:TRINITY_DN2575_c0_g1_i1.p1 TRINITY_DN2575_c0_g1~~TRINITY_DN2575_c0_g1_i1.p1  ORF type:complete len:141 (+),score=22.03 TRINITY_DN2575_c0_g1_i1:39-425(+)
MGAEIISEKDQFTPNDDGRVAERSRPKRANILHSLLKDAKDRSVLKVKPNPPNPQKSERTSPPVNLPSPPKKARTRPEKKRSKILSLNAERDKRRQLLQQMRRREIVTPSDQDSRSKKAKAEGSTQKF